MKKFTLSVVTVLSMSAFAVAGGDIAPVEPEVVVPAPELVVVDESGPYLGVAYSAARYRGDYDLYYLDELVGSAKAKVDYNAIMGQAGYKFNKYVAIEGRYWHSIGDGDWSWSWEYEGDSASDSGSDGGHEFEAWGAYLKPMYPVTEQLDVYALLGYGNVTLSNDDLGDWLDENGFQWGLGASYDITENLSIFADYVRLFDDSKSSTYHIPDQRTFDANIDETVYTVNIGLTYKF